MKGNEQIIINFNRLVANELYIANRYFLYSRVFKHWGLTRLCDVEYKEFLDEINHADRYIERILFLEGKLDNIKNFNNDLYSIKEKDSVEKILRINLDLEMNTINDLRECISYAETVCDFTSRNIMVDILIDEEKHINFLETEINVILQVGVQNYLQSQLQ